MKKLCEIKTKSIWLANPEREIFGIGNGEFIDSSGKKFSYDESFAPYPGREEIEKKLQEENNREQAKYIAMVCSGLISFTDQEIEWEIDDGFGNFGFKDQQGNVVIEPQYAWVGEFAHGLCPVNLGRTWYHTPDGHRYYENHYGYIDVNGKTVIPFRFEEAHSFNKYGVAVVADDTGTYMIDTQGNEIDGTRYPYLKGRTDYMDYNERYIEFSPAGSQYDVEVEDNVGLYDTKERKILCEPRYESFIQYDEETILVSASRKERPDDMCEWFINSKGEYKATPHNSVRGIAPRFYVTKRRKNAGILGVFQVFKTHLWRKRSSECRRRNCAVLP